MHKGAGVWSICIDYHGEQRGLERGSPMVALVACIQSLSEVMEAVSGIP